MQNDKLGHGARGKHFKKTFTISYMLNSKTERTEFQPIYQNRYLSNEKKKSIFADNSRAEPTILSME